jgi:hypothetical protein
VNSIERIKELIVNGSDGYFDDEDIYLHVTIRIAKDFYDFLVKFGDSPEPYDIDFMMGTIRSGIDEFFQLAYICRALFEKGFWAGVSDKQVSWNYPELRKDFMRLFEHLEDPDLKVLDRLASLFVLAHLELVFLAQNFPSAQFYESPSGSRSWDETMRYIRASYEARRKKLKS